eukprot:8474266-Pyramimonas_sp.AAC.1
MAAVSSAVVCCSTAVTPPTFAPTTMSATTCVAEPLADCVACGAKSYTDCCHLGFCSECVFGNSV